MGHLALWSVIKFEFEIARNFWGDFLWLYIFVFFFYIDIFQNILLDILGKLGRAVSFGSLGTLVEGWSINREPFTSFSKGHPTHAVYHRSVR